MTRKIWFVTFAFVLFLKLGEVYFIVFIYTLTVILIFGIALQFK